MPESDLIATGLRWLLAAVFLAAGICHLTMPQPFLAITPGWVPAPEMVIFVTGPCEIAGAGGLLITRLRAAAGVALALYSVCVFPANVNHALLDLGGMPVGNGLPLAYHLPRLFLQPVIIWWCLYAGGILRWPFKADRQPS